ncbi:hypothetical protein BJ875DRAFT_460054 [Amylocarpus encephaloides]|uniref:F-box domain-containing protein n=1 Tax=Amylocarpus encephaloides TaxID=45428 RepID=A0A9P7YL86_9HELO|nr:hypothetical protein BJ875DRAFT_460054 [Amylocarpus encephaloides]
MDTLPTEIVLQILHQLPSSSLSNIRLTSRGLEVLAFPLLFSHIPKWLDPKHSHQQVLAIAHDAYNRPAVMWSPWGMGTGWRGGGCLEAGLLEGAYEGGIRGW